MDKGKYISIFEKYVRNEASEDEKKHLLTVLRHDRHIQQRLQTELEKADSSLDDDTLNSMYGHIRSAISPQKKRIFPISAWKKAGQWAAIFLLPILSAFLTHYFVTHQTSGNNTPITVSADYGEKAEITLADGSRVWLNSGSSLTYDDGFNRNRRNVRLNGEAYFEVAKNDKRPFIVQTKDMNVQALGTAFNVSAYDNESFVSSVLLEGSIKITAWGQERVLAENERATFDKTRRTLVTDEVYASDFVEWKNGNLYFENRSFEEIANILTRVFNVEIRFASAELRPIRFSGTLGNSSIRNALDILSLTSAMHYEMNGTTIELYYTE
ncbi:MAG: FecR domain-containing protein [Bacteroidia bacterium]|nr:FecR domain-containing protein [Bacteroidia bacterium]